MRTWQEGICVFIALAALAGPSRADQAAPPAQPPSEPAPPDGAWAPPAATTTASTAAASDGNTGDGSEAAEDAGPRKPGRGDFDAGGQVRLPNGPDETDTYSTFNWVTLDLHGRYYLLDWATATAHIPLAVKKPDMLPDGTDPSLIGGMTIALEATLPAMPFQPKDHPSEVAVLLSGAYMREGAMLLSDKDFPLYTGDFEPGFTAGARTRIQLSSLFDFSTTPIFVYQKKSGGGSLQAVQIPTSTILKLGSLVKLSADLGIFTGDGFSFGGDDGGRISAGGALDVKIGPIITHAGAGVASLLTGGLYPTIGDSVYFDLNVKYAK